MEFPDQKRFLMQKFHGIITVFLANTLADTALKLEELLPHNTHTAVYEKLAGNNRTLAILNKGSGRGLTSVSLTNPAGICCFSPGENRDIHLLRMEWHQSKAAMFAGANINTLIE